MSEEGKKMQIVIEIDEDDYRRGCAMADAIRNGTPLPEHHGRLIDADKLRAKFNFPDWGDMCAGKN